jgi:hypothetical protein
MNPSFTVLQEDKWYKELPTENFFIEPQAEFCDLSCHSAFCMGEKIHLFHTLSVGNATLKKIGLGHNNYSLTNTRNFCYRNP